MDQEILTKLSKDLKKSANTITHNEARFLVDSYYQMQEDRMRSAAQIRSMNDGEPHGVLQWLANNSLALEKQIQGALLAYASTQEMGQWAMQVHGIGPTLAAALLAHINLEPWKCTHPCENPKDRCTADNPHGKECHHIRIETAGQLWSFCGLNPEAKWEKGERRPWNAFLKKTCFLIGESFVKCSGNPAAVYAQMYVKRKEYETKKNEAGDYKEQAAAILKARPTHAQKAIYKKGKLPPGHIHARAKRYAVKQFLADYHREAYRLQFGCEPPLPYPIAILGHAHLRAA